MSEQVIWVHGDCLSPQNPAFQAYPDAPALFVWDEALLLERRISLKRLVFMYECLLEMPVAIRRGAVDVEIGRFAEEHQTKKIVTVSSPSPRFATLSAALQENGFAIEIWDNPLFVEPELTLDLRRFSRYWRSVQADALIPR